MRSDDPEPALTWSGRWTLGHRILAVNLLTLALMALSVLYLDAFRNRLRAERERQVLGEAEVAAAAIALLPGERLDRYLGTIGRVTENRYRLYAPSGKLMTDSWTLTGPTYELRDPATQGFAKGLARVLDRGFNLLVAERNLPDFAEPTVDRGQAWPEVRHALASRKAVGRVRDAPDLTPLLSAAAPTSSGQVVLLTVNDRNYTRVVRSQRMTLFLAVLLALFLSVLLSLFLARTIVRPLRRIAIAAHQVRLGRAREVKVPRLPARRDEIGMLARAISDMSQSLRQRIDKIEAFAADVTHELKNPLASLRSAVDSLERVDQPELRAKLLDVVRDDVARLDRLIGDIGEAARTDAELGRARFERIDLGSLIGAQVAGWERRAAAGQVRIAFARPRRASATVLGEPGRLARAIDNIVDNAISFSPPGGLVEIAAAKVGAEVRVRVDDEGPGVPDEAREAIFNRFHSVRPEVEDFGRHSGLGLAISRAIVEGHDGEIDVLDRDDAPSGARFIVRLPAISG